VFALFSLNQATVNFLQWLITVRQGYICRNTLPIQAVIMLSKSMQAALNNQVKLEAASSQAYLAMASWSEIQPGLDGVAEFFFMQSEEERQHMLKLMRFINERGGFAVVPLLEQPIVTFKSLKGLFGNFLNHEIEVSNSINELVDLALKEKDYATHNFLQWYVSEQIEEEKTARILNDKLELIGEDKSGLYLFDRDIVSTRTAEKR
jgi:ferritin